MIVTLIIDGVDFTKYIKPDMAYSWTAFDGENATRNLAGDMIRDYITEKDKIELTLIPLSNEKFWEFSNMLKGGKNHNVKYQGTPQGQLVEKICYCTSYSGNVYRNDENEGYLWQNVAFNLIEL